MCSRHQHHKHHEHLAPVFIPITLAGTSGPPGPPGPSYLYGRVKFVDPVNGSDSKGNGGVGSPFQTITQALASITDNSFDNRYVIFLTASTSTLEANPIIWKSWISLVGLGKASNIILSQDINYTSAVGEGGTTTSSIEFVGVATNTNAFNIDTSLSINVNVRFVGCRCNINFNGGTNTSTANNLLLESNTQVVNLNIAAGPAHAYACEGFFGTVKIADNTNTYLEIVGGNVQGTITLNGKAKLFTRGVLNSAVITGVLGTGGDVPLWETDASSLTPPTNITRPLVLTVSDEQLNTVTASYTVKDEGIILFNSGAATTITLPPASQFIGRETTIKNINTGIATITPFLGNTIDGSASIPLAKCEARGIVSDRLNWYILRAYP